MMMETNDEADIIAKVIHHAIHTILIQRFANDEHWLSLPYDVHSYLKLQSKIALLLASSEKRMRELLSAETLTEVVLVNISRTTDEVKQRWQFKIGEILAEDNEAACARPIQDINADCRDLLHKILKTSKQLKRIENGFEPVILFYESTTEPMAIERDFLSNGIVCLPQVNFGRYTLTTIVEYE